MFWSTQKHNKNNIYNNIVMLNIIAELISYFSKQIWEKKLKDCISVRGSSELVLYYGDINV